MTGKAPEWYMQRPMLSEEEWVALAINNVVERKYDVPAESGYTDAWIEADRDAILRSYVKVEHSIKKHPIWIAVRLWLSVWKESAS